MRSLVDYKNYGIEVERSDNEARTAKKLLEDKKLDYLYLLKRKAKGGIAEEKISTIALCLVDRIKFEIVR